MYYCLSRTGTHEYLHLPLPFGRGREIILFNTPQAAGEFAKWYEEEHGIKLACWPYKDGQVIR